MPLYIYQNPNNEEEIIEVIQRMTEPHVFERDGIKWSRIWEIPQASIDTVWNAENPNDFIEKSGKKRGTLGQIMDKSAELSEARRQKYGKDPIKEKKYKEYSDLRGGRDHPELRKEKAKEAANNVMVKLNKKLGY